MHTIKTSKGNFNFSLSLCNAILDGRAFLKGYGNEIKISINAVLLHGDNLHVYYNNVPDYLAAIDTQYKNVVILVSNNQITLSFTANDHAAVTDTFF